MKARSAFCPTPACEVVCFGPDSLFISEDVSLSVFQKERPGERTVCHCFDVTAGAHPSGDRLLDRVVDEFM
jgi:hypothetical protein